MRHYTRIIFGVNAAYQTIVGILCLVAPALAIGIYGGSEVDQGSTLTLVAFRIIGVNLIPVGVICALISFNPDHTPVLRQLMGLLAVLTLVCWGVAVSTHNLSLSQIASVSFDAVVQVMVIVAVVGYYPVARTQQLVIRRRAA